MSLKQILSMVQFSRGTNLVWNAIATPIPDGVIAFSIDDGVFKMGDGVTQYQHLSTLFTYNDLVSAQGGISEMFQEPVLADNGKIVICSLDAGTSTMKYAVSNVTLASLLSQINALEVGNVSQDTAIATLMAYALSIDVSINTAPDDSIVIVNNKRYCNSGVTLAGAAAQIVAGATYTPGSHLEEPIFYTTADKVKTIDRLKLYDDSIYYVDIVGYNNYAGGVVYGLIANNPNVTVTNVSGSLFSVKFNSVTGNVKDDAPVILTASVDDGTNNSLIRKAIGCLVQRQRILVTLYGGPSGAETFRDATFDSKGNIYAVGWTSSEGLNAPPNSDGLIVKFDSSLNILAKKHYGGNDVEQFIRVLVDSNDSVFVTCNYISGSLGGYDTSILKLDSNLNILVKKTYGSSGGDAVSGIALDSLNNVFVVGYTWGSAGGVASDAFILKLDNNLNKIADRLYGGSGYDRFMDIAIDSAGNIVVAGYQDADTYSEPSMTVAKGMIVKFDTNLNVLAHKVYGTTGVTRFSAIDFDINNNLYIVGTTNAEGVGSPTYINCLILKLDSSLAILARKVFGGALTHDEFFGVRVDRKNGFIYAVGIVNEWAVTDSIMVRFDSSLTPLIKKSYNGSLGDSFNGVAVDSVGTVVIAGATGSQAVNGNVDALLLKFGTIIPTGSFVGAVVSALTLADVTNLTLADSTLTMDSGSFIPVTSSLVFGDSILVASDSYLYQVKDTIN